MADIAKIAEEYAQGHEGGDKLALKEGFVAGAEWGRNQSPWITGSQPHDSEHVFICLDNGMVKPAIHIIVRVLDGHMSVFMADGKRYTREQIGAWMRVPKFGK